MNLDELQTEVERLLSLLKERQTGHMTWHMCLHERLTSIQTILAACLQIGANMGRMTRAEFEEWKKSVDLSKIEMLPDTLPKGCVLWDLHNLKKLPDTLPEGCVLYGLHSVKKLPDKLPEGCVLYGLRNLKKLPDTLPKGCLLCDLHSVEELPDNLPEGCRLHDLRNLKKLPDTLPSCSLYGLHNIEELPRTLPEGCCLSGLLPWVVIRNNNTLQIGCEEHTIECWRKHVEEIANRHNASEDERRKVRQILAACK